MQFPQEQLGTRYDLAAIRILVDPNDPGELEVPDWDDASRKKVADALTVLGATLPDWRGATGRKDEVDPVRHLIVTATGWRLNPDRDAVYLNITPRKNDGKTVYKLSVKDVPADHERVELHGAARSSTSRDLERYVDVPGGAAAPVASASEKDNCDRWRTSGCSATLPWPVQGPDLPEPVSSRQMARGDHRTARRCASILTSDLTGIDAAGGREASTRH